MVVHNRPQGSVDNLHCCDYNGVVFPIWGEHVDDSCATTAAFGEW